MFRLNSPPTKKSSLSLENVTWLTKSFWILGSKSKFRAPPPLLDWKVVHQKMPWNIVFLLGGGFALAKGSEVTFLRLPGIYVFLGVFHLAFHARSPRTQEGMLVAPNMHFLS